MRGALAARNGFALLGLQALDLHARQWLTGFHELAFLHQDFSDAAGVFGGDVDFGGFDAAVAADQAFGCLCAAPLLPAIGAQGGCGNDERGDGQFLVHGHGFAGQGWRAAELGALLWPCA